MSEDLDRDPHVDAAIIEEQQLLRDAMQKAQADYLLNRCVTLAAELSRRHD